MSRALEDSVRVQHARQAAERIARDVRAIGRRSTDATGDLPMLVQAVSDLAESVVGLAAALEAMNRGD
jgi:hypothetical protein